MTVCPDSCRAVLAFGGERDALVGQLRQELQDLERHIDSKLNGVEERLEKSLLDLSSRLP
jgi:hypothetical protein